MSTPSSQAKSHRKPHSQHTHQPSQTIAATTRYTPDSTKSKHPTPNHNPHQNTKKLQHNPHTNPTTETRLTILHQRQPYQTQVLTHTHNTSHITTRNQHNTHKQHQANANIQVPRHQLPNTRPHNRTNTQTHSIQRPNHRYHPQLRQTPRKPHTQSRSTKLPANQTQIQIRHNLPLTKRTYKPIQLPSILPTQRSAQRHTQTITLMLHQLQRTTTNPDKAMRQNLPHSIQPQVSPSQPNTPKHPSIQAQSHEPCHILISLEPTQPPPS